jgi:hypothetical protein
MSRLYLLADKAEIDRRRVRVGPGVLVEVWQDLQTPDIAWLGDEAAGRVAYGTKRTGLPAGFFWVGEESRRALDAAGAGPIAPLLAVDDTGVALYYGPRLADVESLPSEESLRARVLSAHGIAVAWITHDQSGARTEYEPASPADPVFLLRRAGSRVAHRWRLFRTRREALVYMAEYYGKDAEARQWAEALPVADFEELLSRFGSPA